MDTLALTDRDGTYGAVKFAQACRMAGIRPVLGVDLAYRPVATEADRRQGRSRTPVRGGAFRDPTWDSLPRVTLLASAGGPGGGRAGWAAICRLVSAVHLAGERGRPVATLDLLAPWLATGAVTVLLGPGSEIGTAVARGHGRGGRDDLADAALAAWREVVPAGHLHVELVSHRLGRPGPGGTEEWGPGSAQHAARMARVARRAGIGSVLTNAVRYADRRDAPTVDVLDAARRLVALDRRHLDRVNAEGFLKSGKQMLEVAEEVCRMAGLEDPQRLLARTRAVADSCALDPRADLGLGEVHFPELDVSAGEADGVLRARCEGAVGDRYGSAPRQRIWKRLDDELELIRGLGYASYFLTVADVTDLIRERGVRCAARGSGAGSLVNYLLGVSGIDPIRHHLLMERFLSPLRESLPDIDVDVESARRTEIYEAILDRFGGERCVCVSMMDTYRVRHAVRDVGAALGMPPGEIDTIAKAFPHIRARDARVALRELPELRASGIDARRLDLMFGLVERLDGLPRHIAVHPCGVLLSDTTLLDRTPVEASFAGFPMSQFDKDDVEELGLLKLDVLGIRMQSSMAHAVELIRGTTGVEVDLDDQQQVRFADDDTYRMISAAKTLGVFQIESPGQRELVGKSGIDSFDDIITDISLFRPGPVKSDMITPYLDSKQGWKEPTYLHDDLRPILGDTQGVVVFHEQVIEIIARFARISYAEADECRRALGDVEGMAEVKQLVLPARARHRLLRAGRRGDLEDPRGVRVVRVLQGARRGVRAADVPVRVAQGALAGALPGRRAHPRPGHVPQAADPRRRPPVRDHRARPRRQRLGEGVRRRVARPRGPGRRRPAAGSRDRRPRRHRLGHPAGAGRGEGHQRGRGRPDRGRPVGGPGLRLAHRLLAPRPGVAADRRAAGAGRRLRLALRHRGGRCPRGHPPPRPDHPPRPAAPGRRARPPRPRPRPGPGPQPARSRAGTSPPGRPGHPARRRGRAPQQHRPAGPRARRPARCPSGTPSPSRGSGRAPPPRPSRPRRRGRSTRSSSRSPWATSPARPSPGCPR